MLLFRTMFVDFFMSEAQNMTFQCKLKFSGLPKFLCYTIDVDVDIDVDSYNQLHVLGDIICSVPTKRHFQKIVIPLII